MTDLQAPVSFDIRICSALVSVNSLISKARVRIFYKGLNRNRTYITEEIAEQLVNSLSYVPIKGIFDDLDDDFTDHGKSRQEGKAYGVVPGPGEMNFAWEEHEDDDGETRTYACCDVYLWTGLYEDASKIVDKPQSMELNPLTILGAWKRDNEIKYFEYTFAEFLGLQALGKDVEPCFEGSAFFTLIEDVQNMMSLLHTFEKSQQDLNNKLKGGNVMKFKLSHEDIYAKLSAALNSKTDEDGYMIYEYGVGPVYDTYTIANHWKEGKAYRVNYTVADGSVTLGDKEEVFLVDVTAAEYASLQAVKAMNGETYEKIDTNFKAATDSVADFSAKLETANATIGEKDATIATLEAEKGELTTTNATLTETVTTHEATIADQTAKYTALESDIEGLKEFKLARETEEKEAIFAKFEKVLDDEEIAPFREKLADFTATDLNKELSVLYVLKQEKTSTFNFVPTGDPAGAALSGAEKLIAKHVNKEEK